VFAFLIDVSMWRTVDPGEAGKTVLKSKSCQSCGAEKPASVRLNSAGPVARGGSCDSRPQPRRIPELSGRILFAYGRPKSCSLVEGKSSLRFNRSGCRNISWQWFKYQTPV